MSNCNQMTPLAFKGLMFYHTKRQSSTKQHTALHCGSEIQAYNELPVQNRVAHNPCSMHTASNRTVFVSHDCWSRSWEFQPRRVSLLVTWCTHELAAQLYGWRAQHCLHDRCDDVVFRQLCTDTNSHISVTANHAVFYNTIITAAAATTTKLGLRPYSKMLA